MSELVINVTQEEIKEMEDTNRTRPKSVAVLVRPLTRFDNAPTSSSRARDTVNEEECRKRHAQMERQCEDLERNLRKRQSQLVETTSALVQARQEEDSIKERQRSYGRKDDEHRTTARDRRSDKRKDLPIKSSEHQTTAINRTSTEDTTGGSATKIHNKTVSSSKPTQLTNDRLQSNEKNFTVRGQDQRLEVQAQGISNDQRSIFEYTTKHTFQVHQELRFFNYDIIGGKWQFPLGRAAIVLKMFRDYDGYPRYDLRDKDFLSTKMFETIF